MYDFILFFSKFTVFNLRTKKKVNIFDNVSPKSWDEENIFIKFMIPYDTVNLLVN